MSLNKELLLAIADIVEKLPKSRHQQRWGVEHFRTRPFLCGSNLENDICNFPCLSHVEEIQNCGTTFCIAGFAIILSSVEERREAMIRIKNKSDVFSFVVHQLAQELLGLSYEDSLELFSTEWEPEHGKTVPEALREIAETGHVKERTSP